MKIYKVGGYVRDTLLSKESKDIDYVVVGASINDMEKFTPQKSFFQGILIMNPQGLLILRNSAKK